jgi:hypothetical protein
MPVRRWSGNVTQSDYAWALHHKDEFDALISIGHEIHQVLPHRHKVDLLTDDQGSGPNARSTLPLIDGFVRDLPLSSSILVHCAAGQNRSSCITAFVRHIRLRCDLFDILKEQIAVYASETPPHSWGPPGDWPDLFLEYKEKTSGNSTWNAFDPLDPLKFVRK